MRRVAEAVGPENVYQFGIRSGTAEEYALVETYANVRRGDQPTIEKIVKEWDGRPVYLTLDIDVIDPAYAPGTGTPERAVALRKKFCRSLVCCPICL